MLGVNTSDPLTVGNPIAVCSRRIACQMGTGGNHTLSTMDLSYSIQITDKNSKVTRTREENVDKNKRRER